MGEAVFEDAGDQGALGVLADFLLDEGGEDDGVGEVRTRVRSGSHAKDSPAGSLRPSWAATWRKRLTMAARISGGRGVAGEAVGVGEEIALERGGVGREVGDEAGLAAFGGEEGVAGAEAGGVDCRGDVEDVVALGDGERDEVDVAAGDAGVDLGGGRRGG